MPVVHGDVDFGLSIVARVVRRQTAKIEAHVEHHNANADGLLERLLLAMSDLHLVLDDGKVLHRHLVAETGHRLHLVDGVANLVHSVLELQEHCTPNTVPSVILIQDFPEQVAVAVANGLLVIKATAMSTEDHMIRLEEEWSHVLATKCGAQH